MVFVDELGTTIHGSINGEWTENFRSILIDGVAIQLTNFQVDFDRRASSYDICEDLIVEIFKRLPLKSLLRFRSVSKSLCSCIDSPEFIRLHMLQSYPQKVLIIHEALPRRKDEYFYTLHSPKKLPLSNNGYVGITPDEFPFKNYYILGSCNGVIFICYIEPCKSRHICMWNPSIRRILKIPDNHVLTYRKTYDIIGFGFDPINNDYKIVWINNKYAPGYETNSFVYTMKTGSWSNIASPKITRFHDVVPRGCFVNGVFHWVLAADGIRYHCIMTFDFNTHGFGTIDLPNPSSEKTNYDLMIIDSCLAVMSSEGNNIWIWVRRREHNNNIPCWSVHCKLEGYESAIVVGVATHITTTGNFLVHFAHPYFDQVYNPKTRKGSSVVDIRVSSNIVDMETYVESLELLDTGTTCDQRNQQQPSFVQGIKRRSRTTLRKLIDFFTPCSTPHAN